MSLKTSTRILSLKDFSIQEECLKRQKKKWLKSSKKNAGFSLLRGSRLCLKTSKCPSSGCRSSKSARAVNPFTSTSMSKCSRPVIGPTRAEIHPLRISHCKRLKSSRFHQRLRIVWVFSNNTICQSFQVDSSIGSSTKVTLKLEPESETTEQRDTRCPCRLTKCAFWCYSTIQTEKLLITTWFRPCRFQRLSSKAILFRFANSKS